MTASILANATFPATEGAEHSEGGFHAPGTEIFNFEPLFTVAGVEFTKPMLMAVLGTVIVVSLFWAAFASPKLVPGKLQAIFELGYTFVRDEIARSIIGKPRRQVRAVARLTVLLHLDPEPVLGDPAAAVPGHVADRVPSDPRADGVRALHLLGDQAPGTAGLLQEHDVPAGDPEAGVNAILAPLEFISTILVRPFTHAVQLFANMFAGHVLIAFFAIHCLLLHRSRPKASAW